jgi:acyl-CoA thioesterase-2
MPDAPAPETLPSEEDVREKLKASVPPQFMKQFMRPRPIEIRRIDPMHALRPRPMPNTEKMWMRARGRVPTDQPMQQCLLAYASDMGILGVSARPHGASWMTGGVQMASLDHAMWFHHPFDMSDYVLYAMDSPSSSGGRGFNRGEVFTRDGKLVASVVQEGLMRPRDKTFKN